MEKGRLKVLIIDDTKFERMIVKAYLKSYNMDIFEAADGKEGLDIMKRNSFDLVICDYNMPVMNGQQVIKHMIEDEKLSEIPVVVYTAGGYDDEGEKMLKRSSIAFIEKSNLGEDLIPTLKDILGAAFSTGAAGQEKKIKMASVGNFPQQQSSGQHISDDESHQASPPPPPPPAQPVIQNTPPNSLSGQAAAKDPQISEKEAQQKRFTVFVCLSEISSRLQIRAYLEKAGINVIDAANTLEVRIKSEKEDPDMLIIENSFIETSLMEVIRKPKKTIPFVVVTKRGSDFEADSTMKEYISGVLELPVDRVNLYVLLNDIAGFDIDV